MIPNPDNIPGPDKAPAWAAVIVENARLREEIAALRKEVETLKEEEDDERKAHDAFGT